jgi:hypothetical protein
LSLFPSKNASIRLSGDQKAVCALSSISGKHAQGWVVEIPQP